jgi:hypothetical protein
MFAGGSKGTQEATMLLVWSVGEKGCLIDAHPQSSAIVNGNGKTIVTILIVLP